ncbi:DUF674 family protein [Trifolium medium]|uniref:DUF674 family protein n=1 Tax=Trifolium medium TaxID=97028 RepID=A0A392M0Y8_9FABA|nr:DUF674 family protein [Trifolium medium]
MLLNPRNSFESYCRLLKLNIDDTEPLQYFLCEDNTCEIENSWSEQHGFVQEASTFIVSDDLIVMPNVVGISLNLLQKHGVTDLDAIDKQTVYISKKEAFDLLKLSLVSKTPLTDFMFKMEKFVANLHPRNRLEFWTGEVEKPSDESNSNEMIVKIVRRKSNEQILFVEAEEDFADFVFSFLTFPLGGVLHMLQGISFLNSIDSLYKSMTELSSDRCLKSPELKKDLTNPHIYKKFELRNQILPIAIYTDRNKPLTREFVDPKSSISGGYSKTPFTCMVTYDLVVTPMSSVNVISYLERKKVPLNDLEERYIWCEGGKAVHQA